jgi:hypothetical protein
MSNIFYRIIIYFQLLCWLLAMGTVLWLIVFKNSPGWIYWIYAGIGAQLAGLLVIFLSGLRLLPFHRKWLVYLLIASVFPLLTYFELCCSDTQLMFLSIILVVSLYLFSVVFILKGLAMPKEGVLRN